MLIIIKWSELWGHLGLDLGVPYVACCCLLPIPAAKQHQLMTLDGFMMYLLSPEGDALDPAHTCVFQDMDQPLAHYFISSSHNTYLTDSQIGGPSSTEAYVRYCTGGIVAVDTSGSPACGGDGAQLPLWASWAPPGSACAAHLTPWPVFVCRAFAQGCRCVELDCWEGPGGEPVIYHGHTLTSKILFRDVVQAVRDHAFTVRAPRTPRPA